MTMRITKALLTLLLLQPIFGSAVLGAKQDTQAHKGARNSDDNLKREVRHELTMVPWYSVFDILQYSVSGTEVTLTGAVVNPTVKTDAENAVKHIEGVAKVNDQIEVLPPDESPTTRHNANLFDLDRTGRGGAELSAGDTWLLPYWMARYLKVISAPENKTTASHE